MYVTRCVVAGRLCVCLVGNTVSMFGGVYLSIDICCLMFVAVPHAAMWVIGGTLEEDSRY